MQPLNVLAFTVVLAQGGPDHFGRELGGGKCQPTEQGIAAHVPIDYPLLKHYEYDPRPSLWARPTLSFERVWVELEGLHWVSKCIYDVFAKGMDLRKTNDSLPMGWKDASCPFYDIREIETDCTALQEEITNISRALAQKLDHDEKYMRRAFQPRDASFLTRIQIMRRDLFQTFPILKDVEGNAPLPTDRKITLESVEIDDKNLADLIEKKHQLDSLLDVKYVAEKAKIVKKLTTWEKMDLVVRSLLRYTWAAFLLIGLPLALGVAALAFFASIFVVEVIVLLAFPHAWFPPGMLVVLAMVIPCTIAGMGLVWVAFNTSLLAWHVLQRHF